jgi:hypothetical protein
MGIFRPVAAAAHGCFPAKPQRSTEPFHASFKSRPMPGMWDLQAQEELWERTNRSKRQQAERELHRSWKKQGILSQELLGNTTLTPEIGTWYS